MYKTGVLKAIIVQMPANTSNDRLASNNYNREMLWSNVREVDGHVWLRLAPN